MPSLTQRDWGAVRWDLWWDRGGSDLDVDGNEVRNQHHEEQLVLELAAGRYAGLVLVGVYVGDADDGPGPEEREESLDLGGD